MTTDGGIDPKSFALGAAVGSAATLIVIAAIPTGIVAVASHFVQTVSTGAAMYFGIEGAKKTIQTVDEILVKHGKLKRV